jgi:hypothetical protein
MFYNEYDTTDKSDNLSALGSADSKPPMSLKQTEFSLKQFAKGTRQANHIALNKWKIVCGVGFLEKKHQSFIRGQKILKQIQDGSLYRQTAVADFLQHSRTGCHW